jgi:hypothetical protein
LPLVVRSLANLPLREGIIMRVMSLVFPLSLGLLASSAVAQTMPYPMADTAPVTTVQITAPAVPVRLREEEVRQIAGTYALSNGWRLKVRPASRFIDATIDREKPMRLLAVSADKFVSGDGKVTMEFNRGDFRDEMRMSYVPDALATEAIVISSEMAQR